MRTQRLLPIRSLVSTARLGRRQRLSASMGSAVAARARFEQGNRVVAQAAASAWLGGPLFTTMQSTALLSAERVAA